MEIVKPFFTYLQKFTDLSEEELNQYLGPIIKVRKFGKKEIVTKADDVENYFNFILKGLVRKYYIKHKDSREEINTQISFEGHIIHSQESFHSRRPSEYFVETIEPALLASMTFDDMEKVYASCQRMEHLGRMVITYTMVVKDRWQMKLLQLTPRERFIYFMNKNPEMLQRVPQKYLASFLNIKPETFSRFKHLLMNHETEL